MRTIAIDDLITFVCVFLLGVLNGVCCRRRIFRCMSVTVRINLAQRPCGGSVQTLHFSRYRNCTHVHTLDNTHDTHRVHTHCIQYTHTHNSKLNSVQEMNYTTVCVVSAI